MSDNSANPKYHTYINEDGSRGGKVAENAVVEPGAIVDPFGLVLSGAFVRGGQRVAAGDIVTARGTTIRLAPPLKAQPS